MNRGSIVALDTPAALQRSYGGEMLAVRVSDRRAAARTLGTVPEVRRATVFGETIHVTVGSRRTDWPAAERALAGAGITVLETSDAQPSLEDVFIDRVGGPSGNSS
jgi:ABC-type multidrug transport system ATPase subunit